MDEKGEAVEYRIGNVSAGFMIAFALLCDGAQFLLVFIPVIGELLGWLITFCAIGIFALWFALSGVNYFSGSKAGTKVLSLLSATVIEMVPIINAIPGITMGILGVLVASRAEDVEKAKERAKKTAEVGAGAARPFKIPRVKQLQAVNDNQRALEASNDDQMESEQKDVA